jgi:DnaJ-class molecular chaperone
MTDYYATLGVTRASTADEIKRAYRRLASQHHPDKGGDTARFQEIEEAYRTLSDPEKRAQYDNPQVHVRHGFGGGMGNMPFNMDAIFEMFGARPPEHGHSQRSMRIQLWIGLNDVATGGARVIAINGAVGANNVEINIPPGIEDGDSVRYAQTGPGGSDLIVTFRIRPDAQWERQNENLVLTHPVSMWDLILGGDTVVTSITGDQLKVGIPAMTQPGTMLRVRGHGLPRKHQTASRGDILIRLQARLPETVPEELREHISRVRGQ